MTTQEEPGRQPPPPLDLNLATEEELGRLPGIGPAYAAAIVASRDGEEGSFGSPMDLVERGAILPHVYHGIHDHVYVGAPAEGLRAYLETLRDVRRALSSAAARAPSVLRSRHRRRAAAIAGGLAIASLPLILVLTSLGGSSGASVAESDADDADIEDLRTAEAGAAPASSPEALVTIAATAVPLPDSPVRYIGRTDGDGVALRDACEAGARIGGAWVEGTEVTVEERGTGSCFTWSKVRHGDEVSWVRNTYLVEEQSSVAIVTGTSARLPNPGASWAQEFCIQYHLGGSYYQVCRTFPTLERAKWTPQDLGTYGGVSIERLEFFADCYINRPIVGRPLDRCAFARLGI
jgi:hypothetical protein